MKDSLIDAFMNGVDDRRLYGLLRVEQLYTQSIPHKAAWRVGWEMANLLTRKPLRTATKKKWDCRCLDDGKEH